MRSAVPCSRQRATRRSNWPPRSLKLPGLMRTFSTCSAATRAASGTKWISATNGTEHPSSLSRARIAARFAASRRPCAVSRTISPPAPAMRRTCAAEASVSFVSVLVIDWSRIGLSPPTPTVPIRTSSVGRRERRVSESQNLSINVRICYKVTKRWRKIRYICVKLQKRGGLHSRQ